MSVDPGQVVVVLAAEAALISMDLSCTMDPISAGISRIGPGSPWAMTAASGAAPADIRRAQATAVAHPERILRRVRSRSGTAR